MSNLYEALEVCLQELEQGADIDTALFRYPELASELRPVLEAAVNAKSMTVPAAAAELVRRNRSKVLQQAAQMREAEGRSPQRAWSAYLRRVAVTLIVVLALFVSGTGLVRAASSTLPGDNLYPVKRTWEDVLELFTFNLEERVALEVEHENERLHELRELFAEGRSAEVDFSGLVTSQDGAEWIVSGVPVMVTAQTELRDGPIVIGSAVRVRGHARADGVVLAERIRRLSSDAKLPDVDIDDDREDDGQDDDNSGRGSGDDSDDDRRDDDDSDTRENDD